MTVDVILEDARKLLAQGEPGLALARLDDPGNTLAESAESLIVRSRAFVLLADGDSAHQTLLRARKIHADNLDVLAELGRLYVKANSLPAARDIFSEILEKLPGDVRGLNGLADVSLATGDFPGAISLLRQILAADPDDHVRARQLGHALMLSGQWFEAAACLEPLVDRYPDDGKTAFLCGQAYYTCDMIDKAVSLFQRASAGQYRDLASCALVGCLIREGKLEDALSMTVRELERGSSCTSALHVHRSAIFSFSDNKAAAAQSVQAALAHDPENAGAWFARTDIEPAAVTDDEIRRMTTLCERGSVSDRAKVCFALANVFRARADVGSEMALLDRGNRLIASERPYDAEGVERLWEDMMGQFPPLREPPEASDVDGDFRPVFILGLPRSGTTLTERILAAHPLVQGSGESLALLHAMGSPEIGRMKQEWIGEFARKYAAFQRDGGFGAPIVADKSISLYLFPGMLQRAFPEARFIALDRHPMDLALGCWRVHFLTGHSYIYEPGRLAHAISIYRRALDYWGCQSGIRMLRLNYEELAADPDTWVPRLAAHIGVDFDEKMLSPESSAGKVMTASTFQIRKKINTASIGRWRKYAGYLEPFSEAFEEFGIEYPR